MDLLKSYSLSFAIEVSAEDIVKYYLSFRFNILTQKECQFQSQAIARSHKSYLKSIEDKIILI